MQVYIQTRGARIDYCWIPSSPSNQWWRAYESWADFQYPCFFVDLGPNQRVKTFVAGLPSSRRDFSGTPIRLSLAVEIEHCDEPSAKQAVMAFISYVAEALTVRDETSEWLPELREKMDRYFPEEIVECWLAERSAAQSAEKDVKHRFLNLCIDCPISDSKSADMPSIARTPSGGLISREDACALLKAATTKGAHRPWRLLYLNLLERDSAAEAAFDSIVRRGGYDSQTFLYLPLLRASRPIAVPPKSPTIDPHRAPGPTRPTRRMVLSAVVAVALLAAGVITAIWRYPTRSPQLEQLLQEHAEQNAAALQQFTTRMAVIFDTQRQSINQFTSALIDRSPDQPLPDRGEFGTQIILQTWDQYFLSERKLRLELRDALLDLANRVHTSRSMLLMRIAQLVSKDASNSRQVLQSPNFEKELYERLSSKGGDATRTEILQLLVLSENKKVEVSADKLIDMFLAAYVPKSTTGGGTEMTGTAPGSVIEQEVRIISQILSRFPDQASRRNQLTSELERFFSTLKNTFALDSESRSGLGSALRDVLSEAEAAQETILRLAIDGQEK